MVFYSKSAQLEKEQQEKVKIIKKIIPEVVEKFIKEPKIVYWYGEIKECAKLGKSLGYNVRPLKDPESVIHAKALVFYEYILGSHTISTINMAVNYGIPVIWIHSQLVPYKWVWSFYYCYVGSFNIGTIWKEICLL